MPRHCAFPGCKTNQAIKRDGKDVAFRGLKVFTFPKDSEQFAIWEKYTGRANLREFKNGPYLCELHFEQKYIKARGKSYTCTDDAVPTVEFDTSKQVQLVYTPDKGKNIAEYVPKVTRLSFREEFSGVSSSLLDDIDDFAEKTSENKKI